MRSLKNIEKHHRVASKSMFGVCTHASKVDRKSFQTRFLTELRDSSLSKGACFEHLSLEVGSLGCLWALLGDSWGALGRSWGALGRSWGALARSWGALGRSWGALGRSWGALGHSCEALGALLVAPGACLGDLGLILEPPRVDFGSTQGRI